MLGGRSRGGAAVMLLGWGGAGDGNGVLVWRAVSGFVGGGQRGRGDEQSAAVDCGGGGAMVGGPEVVLDGAGLGASTPACSGAVDGRGGRVMGCPWAGGVGRGAGGGAGLDGGEGPAIIREGTCGVGPQGVVKESCRAADEGLLGEALAEAAAGVRGVRCKLLGGGGRGGRVMDWWVVVPGLVRCAGGVRWRGLWGDVGG